MRIVSIPSRFLWCAAGILWAAAAIGVWVWTTNYEFKASPAGEAVPERWPEECGLRLAEERPTLLFFLHPKCPCTRASIRELDRILTGRGLSAKQRPKVIAVATVPGSSTANWRQTDTVQRIARLPHSEVMWDVEGQASRWFGAVTSGTVLLFDRDGKRLFAGGITSSRGHEGDNLGSNQVWAELVEPRSSTPTVVPAFGCRLCTAADRTSRSAAPTNGESDEKFLSKGHAQ